MNLSKDEEIPFKCEKDFLQDISLRQVITFQLWKTRSFINLHDSIHCLIILDPQTPKTKSGLEF